MRFLSQTKGFLQVGVPTHDLYMYGCDDTQLLLGVDQLEGTGDPSRHCKSESIYI